MAARWAASRVSADAVASLRDRYCEETGGQVLHYSFYIREGWVACYALHRVGEAPEHSVGYCAVVEAGPWEGKPAVFQFWVSPSDRMATFALFEVACEAAGAVGVATQLNAPLLPALMHAYCVQVTTESIVFEDQHPALRLEAPEGGSQLRSLTSSDDTASAMAKGRGGCEFSLHAGDGPTVATGGISFHYNPVRPGGPPYGDIYYEVAVDRRGQVIKKPHLCVMTVVCVCMCDAELTAFIPVCCVWLCIIIYTIMYNLVSASIGQATLPRCSNRRVVRSPLATPITLYSPVLDLTLVARNPNVLLCGRRLGQRSNCAMQPKQRPQPAHFAVCRFHSDHVDSRGHSRRFAATAEAMRVLHNGIV